MAAQPGGDLRIGDTVWHFESRRRPPQSRHRVRAITVLDGEARPGRSAAVVPWSVVRSDPHAVKVELETEWCWGSQVFPCAEPLADGDVSGERDARRTALVVAAAAGVVALLALALFVLFAWGPLVFVLVQAGVALALAVFTQLVWPRLRR